jgi:hypothetical protein
MRLIDADALNWGRCPASGKLVSDWLAEAPTIEAEPVRHGRWMMKETMIRSPYAKNAYCSECLEETSYAHKYCPNCGAKMDGGGGE